MRCASCDLLEWLRYLPQRQRDRSMWMWATSCWVLGNGWSGDHILTNIHIVHSRQIAGGWFDRLRYLVAAAGENKSDTTKPDISRCSGFAYFILYIFYFVPAFSLRWKPVCVMSITMHFKPTKHRDKSITDQLNVVSSIFTLHTKKILNKRIHSNYNIPLSLARWYYPR